MFAMNIHVANKLYKLYELYMYVRSLLYSACVLIRCCWLSIFEPFECCKAHLVRLTAEVQQTNQLAGIDQCKADSTCMNHTGKKKRINRGANNWSFELDSSEPETVFWVVLCQGQERWTRAEAGGPAMAGRFLWKTTLLLMILHARFAWAFPYSVPSFTNHNGQTIFFNPLRACERTKTSRNGAG